jgi:hypothetical protein
VARDWLQIMRDAAQPHCEEPVITAALVQPRGSMGVAGLSQISGIAAVLRAKGANKAAGGLGKTGLVSFKYAVMALTEHTVVVCEAMPKGFGVKVKKKLAEWPRADLEFAHEQKTMTKALTFDVKSTGEHYELEMTSMMDKGISDAFVAALGEG